MNPKFNKCLCVAISIIFFAVQIFAADTKTANLTNAISGMTQQELANSFLQIQEQLHATQLALEQDQLAAADQTRSNADFLTARLQALEQTVADQRNHDAEAARQTQQTTLFLAGIFGLAGLSIVLALVYLQWRALTQFTQVSAQHNAMVANTGAIQQLAAPGRAVVENSTARLLDVISQLERRIDELEGGQRLLPGMNRPAADGPPSASLTEGQQYLDANLPQKALDFYDQFLAAHPDNAEAIVKKAETLEKLGRNAEALNYYEQALQVRNRKADKTVMN
jgi:tetratricopeptide (TPR) repeat protein